MHVLFGLQTFEQQSVSTRHGDGLFRQHLPPMQEESQQSLELSHAPWSGTQSQTLFATLQIPEQHSLPLLHA